MNREPDLRMEMLQSQVPLKQVWSFQTVLQERSCFNRYRQFRLAAASQHSHRGLPKQLLLTIGGLLAPETLPLLPFLFLGQQGPAWGSSGGQNQSNSKVLRQCSCRCAGSALPSAPSVSAPLLLSASLPHTNTPFQLLFCPPTHPRCCNDRSALVKAALLFYLHFLGFLCLLSMKENDLQCVKRHAAAEQMIKQMSLSGDSVPFPGMSS